MSVPALADKIRQVRGDLSQREFAKKVNLSLRTILKIEAGDKPRRSNLLQIVERLGLNPAERLDFLASWLRAELGEEDFELLNMTPKINSPGSNPNPLEEFRRAAAHLRTSEQELLLQVCKRPLLLEMFPVINRFYDRVKDAGLTNHEDPSLTDDEDPSLTDDAHLHFKLPPSLL